jgi:hypothetical protein
MPDEDVEDDDELDEDDEDDAEEDDDDELEDDDADEVDVDGFVSPHPATSASPARMASWLP